MACRPRLEPTVKNPITGVYRSSSQVLITRAAAAAAQRRGPTNPAPAPPPGASGAGASGAPQDWGRGARSRDTVRLQAPWSPLGKRSLTEPRDLLTPNKLRSTAILVCSPVRRPGTAATALARSGRARKVWLALPGGGSKHACAEGGQASRPELRPAGAQLRHRPNLRRGRLPYQALPVQSRPLLLPPSRVGPAIEDSPSPPRA
jgi:hypothetical protein